MKAILKIFFVMFVCTFQPAIAQNGNANGKQKTKVKVNKQHNNRGNEKDNRDYNDDNAVYNDDDGVFTDDVYDNDNSGKLKKQKITKGNNGNGNAYGRNKGNLTGREFGQERARQAKLKRDDRIQILTRTVRVSTERTRTARERINRTLEDLAEMRRRRAITEAQYTARMQDVNRVEQQVLLVEDLLQLATTLNVSVNIN